MNVIVEKWPRTKIGFWESRLKHLKDYIWVSRHPTQTLRISRRAKHGQTLLLRDLAGRLARAIGITEDRINQWEINIYGGHPEIEALYARYHPDLVLYTRHFATNLHVIKEAKRRGIPCFCFVEGWDNLTSKTAFSVVPEHVIVWNELMRDEAVRIYGYPPEQIDVVGAAPMDPYFAPSGLLSREELFSAYRLDPGKKLVTYATATEGIAKDEIEIAGQLYRSIQLLLL